mmetsp:Transcript_6136/g.10479  ORF Transcript_6136/g.10479 Transcript_6136/m.10479 type:complete len:214 (-) Transcript_6136:74-715(-)|eukprot:CAMPEP_0197433050 /NCGR_PEP_ID=MMETSP1175-20131217/1003_1 /TAXON_ID=1003142 /ORGANISM="Triceratium dubium, Strain CCMP147" /LENGTH=213 /DNA_ID=CAMNT_0042961307 /DNA_START=33 /DNA_END=674 /DNA_ORIENTATION=-
MVNATKSACVAAVALVAMCSNVESLQTPRLSTVRSSAKVVTHAYIPSGFTKESWAEFQKKDKAKKQGNLGRMGPKGFQSRSMQSFQEALERGEAAHLMPVFNAKERVKRGELKTEDIPYMQRGGNWDNSDVKGAKKKRWLASDKQYAAGGFKKEQSVSIFGVGEGLDWTGKQSRRGPEGVMGKAPKFSKNYKAPNVNDLKDDSAPKKKFFGLF